uniref:Uncharacterized protein n=1 Tax=Anguilla anguilla TaxID=7936 RepID=A0A0E9WEX5_ANGAN
MLMSNRHKTEYESGPTLHHLTAAKRTSNSLPDGLNQEPEIHDHTAVKSTFIK